jgi:hypothetical protein
MVMISSFIFNLYRNFRLFMTDAGNKSLGGLALECSPVLSACILGDPASAVENNVNAYVKRGIDRNQINVLLIYTKEQQKFIESIERVENVNLIFNSQDIMIIPADEGFYDDGSFSAIPSLNRIRDIGEVAKQNSKNGLNVWPLCQLN